jgi:hypothetical protein
MPTCPVCRKETTLTEDARGVVLHPPCITEMEAARALTASCPHRKTKTHDGYTTVCMECGALRCSDGKSWEPPIRCPDFRLVYGGESVGPPLASMDELLAARGPSGPPTYTPRTLNCVMCQREVVVEVHGSTHPEAPDMFGIPEGAYVGCMRDGASVTIIVACSHVCVQRLLAEQAPRKQ